MNKMIDILAAVMMTAVGASANAGVTAEDLVKGFEGFSSTAYTCTAGKRTIGYGFTFANLVGKGHITEAAASAEVRRICTDIAVQLRKELGAGNILKPHEEAAVVSLIYNIGWTRFRTSELCRLLKAGRRGASVVVQFHRWRYVTQNGRKVVCKGLDIRRNREAQVFLYG